MTKYQKLAVSMISLADRLADLNDRTERETARATVLLIKAEKLNTFKAVSPSNDRFYHKQKARYKRWLDAFNKR
jgi:hypothetical protein